MGLIFEEAVLVLCLIDPFSPSDYELSHVFTTIFRSELQNSLLCSRSAFAENWSNSLLSVPSPLRDRASIVLKFYYYFTDWALLSADLHFIYLDPVLQSHLEEQAESLIGKSLLSFVHPEEQASAKQDLGGVLDSRTLHGSVTRCVPFTPITHAPQCTFSVRFSRLTNVRRQLGYDGPPHSWAEAEKIALDKDYMAVDVVINWAAEGLVLCFLHAIVDLSPGDNDETQKTDWTNWCGTPYMSTTQIEVLWRALLMCVPQPGNMSRVFQILSAQRDRPFLISWPPNSDQGPNSRDFAKLVENVQIGADVDGAKTSCTRRYRSSQRMPQVFGGEVESIFIPHGKSSSFSYEL